MGADILVTENDAKQAYLIRVYLEREGYHVSVVPDGRRAPWIWFATSNRRWSSST
jgi:DNA-binding response OmpR family regulator